MVIKMKNWEFWDELAKSDKNNCVVIQARGQQFIDLSSFFSGLILDAGCGYGRISIPLSKKGNSVIALDASSNMLKRLNRHKITYNLQSLHPVRADITKLPLKDEIFDGIICYATIYYIHRKYWKQVINEFYRVLKPNGRLYIQFIKLNKIRLKERLGEILVLFGKRRTWAKTYYLPCFMIKRLLSKYFNSVKIKKGETFEFLCEGKKLNKHNRIKVLYVCFNYSSIVRRDIMILKKHFDVEFILYKGVKNVINFLLILSIKALKSNIIFSRFASTHAFFAVLVSKIFRKKSIVVIGGFDIANIPEINYGFAKSWITKVMLKFTLNYADKVLPVAEALKQDAIKNLGVRGDNFHVVHNGYETEKWKPSGEKENIVITACGDLTELVIKRKGIETFINAAKYVPDARFIVIGRRTDESKELEKKAPKNVMFIDFMPQEELLKYYQKAKVYCQLSRYEGHPNALSEAMLCECVPVGTKYGGIPEVIGDTGFYVPYGDAKATAEAIKKALNSNKGKEARERIETLFPLERRETALFNIVHELLGGEHEKHP